MPSAIEHPLHASEQQRHPTAWWPDCRASARGSGRPCSPDAARAGATFIRIEADREPLVAEFAARGEHWHERPQARGMRERLEQQPASARSAGGRA